MKHHAFLFEGSLGDFPALAAAARKILNLNEKTSPDVYERIYDKFGIDESRELTQLASLRGVGEQTLFVLGTSSITTEAQQALLKLFEEPREGLTFVILMPHGVILPTLRSRMMPLELRTQNLEFRKPNPETKKFLSANPKERSEMLAKVLKQDDAKEQLHALLNEIESMIHTSKKEHRIEALSEIAAMRPFLSDRAPSLKMIFEHLAVVLPKL